MNNVNLIGRITKDLEIKMTKADTPMISFTLACKRKLTNKEGEKLTDFFNCVAFGSRAEFLAKYACKSTLIGIEGRLQSKVYIDEYEKRHSTVDVVCESVQILRMPNSNQGTTEERKTTPPITTANRDEVESMDFIVESTEEVMDDNVVKHNESNDASKSTIFGVEPTDEVSNDNTVKDDESDEMDKSFDKLMSNFSNFFND